jgi:hypothetical protein
MTLFLILLPEESKKESVIGSGPRSKREILFFLGGKE